MMDTVFMCLYDTINYLTIPGTVAVAAGRTSLSLPAALRLLSLPLPSSSPPAPSMCTGAQGLCACWGRAGPDPEED